MMVVLPQLAPPGLSPRVRGEELILGPRALLRGIIPAGAGRRGRADDLQVVSRIIPEEERFAVLPTLEKELWQSQGFRYNETWHVLPTLEKELWQSAAPCRRP